MPDSFEHFYLKKYQSEVGKDFNRITLYLCCNTDYRISQGIGEYGQESNKDSGSDSDFELPPLKRTRKIKEKVVTDVDDVGKNSVDILNGILQEPTRERDGSGQSIKAGNDHDVFSDSAEEEQAIDEKGTTENQPFVDQIKNDEMIAQQMQEELDQQMEPNAENIAIEDETFNDFSKIVRTLEKSVDTEGEPFIVVRRGAPLTRILSLWRRETSKIFPAETLRIRYHNKLGIDNGAIAKEFLTKVIEDIGKTMFPNGSPVSSTYHIQNGNFKACGQVAAVSLAQGGHPQIS